MPSNSKLIFKNTLLLYVRMFITMAVSLYTSRIVLDVVGIEDYGIYQIVGGIVMLFSFLNNSMINATQRFLSFDLGKNDLNQLKQTFSMSITTHISISLIVIILAETVGLWFLNNRLNIPETRIYAANIVYQFSILTFCINIIRVPYNATIIAFEKMSFYAYVSIAEVILKLLLILSLTLLKMDKLILYSFLMLFSTLSIFLIYYIYCSRKFLICNYTFFWNNQLYVKLLSFSGWSMLGGMAGVTSIQGVNILLNIFWGVVVNASMGIANQINSVLITFVHNFQTAFKPQIVKTYAEDDLLSHQRLVCQASKFSFFLMFFFALPVLMNISKILSLWLTKVPLYSDIFAQLIILAALVDTISGPLWVSVHSTGRIKIYQIIISTIILLNILFSSIFLYLGFEPYYVLIVRVFVNLSVLIFRIIYLQHAVGLKINRFVKEVVLPIFLVIIPSVSLTILFKHFVDSSRYFFFSIAIIGLIVFASIYLLGLKNNERAFLLSFIRIRKNIQ